MVHLKKFLPAIFILFSSIQLFSQKIIDGTNARYIDPDVLETIFNYKHNAYTKGIIVTLENVQKHYSVPKLTNKIVEDINK